VAVAAPRAEEEVVATEAVPAAGDVEMTKEKKEEGAEAAPGGKAGEKAPAKGEAKAAVAGDKKAEAKPDAKAEKKK
jgi:hypothetical protein